jgi:hypothetical protein
MCDAGVSVQQSVRASSPSRAGVGVGVGVIIWCCTSDEKEYCRLNTSRRAEEETRNGGKAMVVVMAVAETKLWRRLVSSTRAQAFASSRCSFTWKGDVQDPLLSPSRSF